MKKGSMMSDAVNVYNKKKISILAVLIIGFMLIGSFFDYQISLTLHDETNLFGLILAAYGQLPASLGILIGATLMIYVTERKMRVVTILSYAGGILLIVFALFMGVFEPISYLKDLVPAPVLAVITLILMLGLDAFVFSLVKHTPKYELKQFVKYIMFAVFVQMIVINIIKIPWGRPRMRMIAVTPEASFQPWWVIGSDMKETLMAMGVVAEEFKSFPSGHTASASCILFIAALPAICPQLKGKENLLFWIAVAFTLLVGFSRIFMGAHFLTDITVGLTIGVLINAFAYKMFIQR